MQHLLLLLLRPYNQHCLDLPSHRKIVNRGIHKDVKVVFLIAMLRDEGERRPKSRGATQLNLNGDRGKSNGAETMPLRHSKADNADQGGIFVLEVLPVKIEVEGVEEVGKG